MESKLNNNLEVLLSQLEHFITTKTVVGQPIHIGDTILVPLVDVSFGVAAGATAASNTKEINKAKEKEKEKNIDGNSDAGVGGLGAKITPSAMLVIQNGTTQLINVKSQDSLSKVIDMVPGIISNFPDMVSKFVPSEKAGDKPVSKKVQPEPTKKEDGTEEDYHHLEK